MKKLLIQIKKLSRKLDEKRMKGIIKYLGETPSIATLEGVVKYYKVKQNVILSKDLLEWMQENDQTTFTTGTQKVTIKTYVSAKVMDSKEAFKWLTKQGFADLIKETLDFSKGDITPKIEEILKKELKLSYSKKTGIHPQSLKKIISDRLEAGSSMPTYDEDNVGSGIQVNYHDECVVKEK